MSVTIINFIELLCMLNCADILKTSTVLIRLKVNHSRPDFQYSIAIANVILRNY